MKKEEQKQNVNSDIDSLINDTMKNLKNMIQTNTVLGDQILLKDGSIVFPVSKVLVGFISGGGDIQKTCKKDLKPTFTGGSGSAYKIVPMGFLVGKNGEYKYIEVESKELYSDLLITANKILKKIYMECENENKK